MKSITASAPAKVNLIFEVGPLKQDGYHDVNSLFLGLNLREEVTITEGLPGTGITIFVLGENLPARHVSAVPRDQSNLVYKAAVLVSEKLGIEVPDIQIDILKRIPVAGGMAGGSADAAAMLLAFSAYAHQNLGAVELAMPDLLDIASSLGSDIPFCVLGGLAIGKGRGDEVIALSPFAFDTHWVLAVSPQGLSTPSVYGKFDELGKESLFTDLNARSQAITSVEELGTVLKNDLEAAAITLMPALVSLRETIEGLGAIRAIVSGSGPTIAALCSSREQAQEIAKTFNDRGIFALTAGSPAVGANLEL